MEREREKEDKESLKGERRRRRRVKETPESDPGPLFSTRSEEKEKKKYPEVYIAKQTSGTSFFFSSIPSTRREGEANHTPKKSLRKRGWSRDYVRQVAAGPAGVRLCNLFLHYFWHWWFWLSLLVIGSTAASTSPTTTTRQAGILMYRVSTAQAKGKLTPTPFIPLSLFLPLPPPPFGRNIHTTPSPLAAFLYCRLPMTLPDEKSH